MDCPQCGSFNSILAQKCVDCEADLTAPAPQTPVAPEPKRTSKRRHRAVSPLLFSTVCDMLRNGHSTAGAVDFLMDENIGRKRAEATVEDAYRTLTAQSMHRRGMMWLAVGIGATVITFLLAPGGIFVIAWGAIVYGIVLISRASSMQNRSSRS